MTSEGKVAVLMTIFITLAITAIAWGGFWYSARIGHHKHSSFQACVVSNPAAECSISLGVTP